MSEHPDHCPSFKGTLEQQAEEIDKMTHSAKKRLFQRLYDLSVQRELQEVERPRYLNYLAKMISPGLKMVIEGEKGCWKICRKYPKIIKRPF